MISPEYYRDARMNAAHHIQARIEPTPDGHGVQFKVIRVFRGPLKRGAVLRLGIHFRPLGPPVLGEPIYSEWEEFKGARYIEAFLDGDPPDVVMEQIKFLKHRPWGRVGNPARMSYDW